MLRRVEVRRFRSLQDVTIEFSPVTALVGENGSGKSSVLEVMSGVREIVLEHEPVARCFHASTLPRHDLPPPALVQSVLVVLEHGGVTFEYTLRVDHHGAEPVVGLETLLVDNQPHYDASNGKISIYAADPARAGNQRASNRAFAALAADAPFQDFREALRSLFVAAPNAPRLADDLHSTEVDLRSDLGNLQPWLRRAIGEWPEAFLALNESVRDAFARLSALRFPQNGGGAVLHATFGEGQRAYKLMLGELSDGQRMLIALYALLHFKLRRGQTLALDEPDNWLSPTEIQPYLQALVDACEEHDAQIIVVSHNPHVVDYLGLHDVLLFELNEHGNTRVRSGHPPPSLRMAGMSTAEWLLAGAPSDGQVEDDGTR